MATASARTSEENARGSGLKNTLRFDLIDKEGVFQSFKTE